MVGIYALSLNDEILYVGQSFDIERRLKTHAKKYPHMKQHIIVTIEDNDEDFLDWLEIRHIEMFNTYHKNNPQGLNKTRGGCGVRGVVMNAESRQKMREKKLGIKQKPEHIAKRAESLKGKNAGKSPWNKGKTLSEEDRKKKSDAAKRRYGSL